jgi:tetratricopeptide (TPR) repeat protein
MLGQVEAGAVLLPQAIQLASTPEDHRALSLLHDILQCRPGAPTDPITTARLTALDDSNEKLLLRLVRALGHVDTARRLLGQLAAIRPTSAAAANAFFEALLVQAKRLLDRMDATGALDALRSLESQAEKVPGLSRAAYFNLLGCCACLAQDLDRALLCFTEALAIARNDPRIEQNLALALDWNDRSEEAAGHWERFLELLNPKMPAAPGQRHYVERLAFESLSCLAISYANKERWSEALEYAERAHALRPTDLETLERLFHLYKQTGRPDEARRKLRHVRQGHPGEAQLDLFELDLIEVRNLDHVEEMVGKIKRLLQRYPHNSRVPARVRIVAGNLIPFLERVFSQRASQLAKMLSQVRHLPAYRVDWSALRDGTRQLDNDFQKLRRGAAECLAFVTDEGQLRLLRELIERIDRRIDQCRSHSK